MKLSIIIPVYCVEATIDRCLESVVGQTFSDFEVLLVDDGSPDRCPQKCDEWARRDSRVRVIHKENGGLSDARNAGLDMARGEYVTFVDSDDSLSADCYEQVMPLAEHADIVEFPLIRFYGSPKQKLIVFPQAEYTDMAQYWLNAHAYEHCYAWNKVYRSTMFINLRFPVGRVFEDVAMLPLLLGKARKVVTTSHGLYYYYVAEDGITSTATGRELSMLLDAHLAVLPQWTDSRYYMHVLNIQLDVCRQTGCKPLLHHRAVSPLAAGLTLNQRLKAIAINIIGIKGLCRLYRKRHNPS